MFIMFQTLCSHYAHMRDTMRPSIGYVLLVAAPQPGGYQLRYWLNWVATFAGWLAVSDCTPFGAHLLSSLIKVSQEFVETCRSSSGFIAVCEHPSALSLSLSLSLSRVNWLRSVAFPSYRSLNSVCEVHTVNGSNFELQSYTRSATNCIWAPVSSMSGWSRLIRWGCCSDCSDYRLVSVTGKLAPLIR